jgi:hypothetical protein
MLAAAESGYVSAASAQIEKALFLDMRLDVVSRYGRRARPCLLRCARAIAA